MAILSAHSRRSPTTTAEFSPTLEQQLDNIELQYSDKVKSVYINTDEDAEHVETSAEENSVQAESRACLYSTCVTEVNLEMLKTSTKEEGSLKDFSKQIDTETEMPKLDTKLISKAENISQNIGHFKIISTQTLFLSHCAYICILSAAGVIRDEMA
jgi:hypothetical protein